MRHIMYYSAFVYLYLFYFQWYFVYLHFYSYVYLVTLTVVCCILIGLLVEEPGGMLLPWQIADICHTITDVFLKAGWSDLHFLIHVHKGFGKLTFVFVLYLLY